MSTCGMRNDWNAEGTYPGCLVLTRFLTADVFDAGSHKNW